MIAPPPPPPPPQQQQQSPLLPPLLLLQQQQRTRATLIRKVPGAVPDGAHKRLPEMNVRRLNAGQLENRGHNVKELHRLRHHVRAHAAGHTHEQWDTRENIFKPRAPLLDEAVVAYQ